MPFLRRLLITSVLITLIFGVILHGLTDYSFWMDEGFSAWIVRDDMREPTSIREELRYIYRSLANTFDHVRDDVHPPLYYLLLDGWTLLLGDSEFILRLPSALLSMIALASTYAIGRIWFNTKTGLIAIILLGTLGFYVYYAREARMYALYLALVTTATWAYSHLWHRPTVWRAMLYSMLVTLLLYTHYTAFTVIFAHILHALITMRNWSQRGSWWKMLLPYGIAGMLFALWIPFFLRQFDINTGFNAPGALPSDLGTLAAIWVKLTSGYWGIFALSLIFSYAIWQIHKRLIALSLIIIWGMLPVLVLFVINIQGLSVLQLRYLIPIVPAWAILVAFLLSDMWIPLIKHRWLSIGLTIFFTGWIAYTQLSTYPLHWQAKSDWRGTVTEASELRDVTQPALTYLDLRSPLVYYAYQANLLNGISINVSWREFAPQEVWQIGQTLDEAPVTWGIVAMQAPESWDAIAVLSDTRGVTYRDDVQWSVFYQFDASSNEHLSFTFANTLELPLLAYENRPFYTRYSGDIGDEICVPIRLRTLADLPDTYSLALQMTRGYNEVVTQVDAVLSEQAIDTIIDRELCLTKPDEDDFHLRLIVYNRNTLSPTYVIETEQYVWGQYLMVGTVEQIIEIDSSE